MSGRVNPKYLPQNFWKMTSSEVEDIFQKSIIFDKRKTNLTFVFTFGIYQGILAHYGFFICQATL